MSVRSLPSPTCRHDGFWRGVRWLSSAFAGIRAIAPIATSRYQIAYRLKSDIRLSTASPSSLTIDSDRNLYVRHPEIHSIIKYNGKGDPLLSFATGSGGAGGSGNCAPLTVDRMGNVYVIDPANSRVQKFDSEGRFVLQIGAYGPRNGQFWTPGGVAVDGSGNVFVSDRLRCCIQKFDRRGNFLAQFGHPGEDNGGVNRPGSLATDSCGNVYVADTGNHRILKFDNFGNFIRQIGCQGNGKGQFAALCHIVVDTLDMLYVSDGATQRLQKFDARGNFLSELYLPVEGKGDSPFWSGEFTVDNQGSIYIADPKNDRLLLLEPVNPQPKVTGMLPDRAEKTDTAIVISITGAGFVASSVVLFGGKAIAPTSVTPNTLLFTVSPELMSRAGNYAVSIRNPGLGGGMSAKRTFLVR